MDEKTLCVVISSCDKHSFLWNGWWHYFNKNWNFDCPIYFLTETKKPSFPVNIINVNIPDINIWTKRIRESILQVPEKDIFFLTEDAFIIKKFEIGEFENIYQAFKTLNADALRIKTAVSKHTTIHDTMFKANGVTIKKLDQHSKYLIAYTPNIWKKSFLLECLKHNESIWVNETRGSQRLVGKDYNIYTYLKLGWWGNACRQGKITPEGKKLLNYG